MTTGVPTFKLRARVVDVNGVAPAGGDSFDFSLHNWATTDAGNRLVGPATTTGTDWTSWLYADPTAIAAAVTYYTTHVSMAYTHMWDIVVCALVLSPAVELTHIAGQIQIEESGKVVDFTAEMFGQRVDILSWRATPSGSPPQDNTTGGEALAGTGAQFNQRYFDLITELVPEPAPQCSLFSIADYWNGGDDTTEGWAGGYKALERLGVNAITLGRVAPQTRAIVEDVTGIRKWAGASHHPPGFAFPYRTDAPGDGGFQPDNLALWSNYTAHLFTEAGCDLSDVVLYNMLDEPAWYFPEELASAAGSSTAMADFRSWLQGKGLTPADIGHTDWTDVVPVGVSKLTGTTAERRLMQLSLQWFAEYSSVYLAQCSAALRQAFGEQLDVAVNWNNGSGRFISPNRYGASSTPPPDTATGGHDWFTFAAHGDASTCLFTETYFWDVWSWQVSNVASRIFSAADRGGVKAGAYLIGGSLGDIPHSGVRKTFAMVGQGLKVITRYRAGPVHIDADGYMESGFRSPDVFTSLAEAATMLAASEDVLYPAKPVLAPVGIVHPKSAQVFDTQHVIGPSTYTVIDSALLEWIGSTVDYMCEALSLGSALQLSAIQPRWIPEDDLTADGLAGLEVVYVTAPNLPAAAQTALADWAAAGGTLVTFPGTGHKDETDSALDTLATTGGISEAAYARQNISTLASWLPFATVAGPGGSAEARGEGAVKDLCRSVVTASEGATIEATFTDNGTPAIVTASVGLGKRTHFAFWPACSFLKDAYATGSHTEFPDAWTDLLRQWIVRPVTQAGVFSPVQVSAPMVEAPMLATEDAAAVVLINWTSETKALDVVLRPVNNVGQPFLPDRVYSVRADADLPFTTEGEAVLLGVDLEYVDVLKIYRATSDASTAGAALLMVA